MTRQYQRAESVLPDESYQSHSTASNGSKKTAPNTAARTIGSQPTKGIAGLLAKQAKDEIGHANSQTVVVGEGMAVDLLAADHNGI